jgi:RNA polymerase sigma factor (sigma-70 family)
MTPAFVPFSSAPISAEDLTLLRCFQRTRDEAAFAELLRRHWPLVVGVCRRRLAPHHAADAEDAAQAVFLLLARKAFWLRREVVLTGWLHRTALNTCRTLQRSRLRQLQRDTEAARQTAHATSPAPAVPASTDSDVSAQLDEALDTLPARLRSAVVLCHLQGRSRREAGVLLGCGENTVSQRLTRALPRLRSVLEKRGVALTAPALLAVLGHTAAEADAATPPTALLLAAAKSQLGPLTVLTASLAALSAWWPAPAMLVVLGAAGLGVVHLRELAAAADHTLPSGLITASAPPTQAVPAPPPPPTPAPKPTQPPAAFAPSARLQKLRALLPGDFERFISGLILAKATPAQVVAAFQEKLDLTVTESEARTLMANSKTFILGTLDVLGQRHPQDTLAWIAGMAERDAHYLNFVTQAILAREPALDLAALTALLPPGPGTESVLGIRRLQADPTAEATRRLADVTDPEILRNRLSTLAANWPQGREADAFSWASKNLQGSELGVFLAGVSYELSHRDPDTALVLLKGLRGSEALAPVLQRAMRGLVQQNRKIPEVLPLVESLTGEARSATVNQLADRWVRVDQEGLIEWLAACDNPADVQAALPMTIAQLTPENRALVLEKLLASSDPGTEVALIRSATPALVGASRDGSTLIERLAQRPGLDALSSDSAGNAALLFGAIVTTASNWVSVDGGDPSAAAAWVDRLPFATPADKTAIARLVYDQWKASDAPAATAWARTAGIPTGPATK